MSVLEVPVSLFLMTQPVSKMIPVNEIKPVAGMFRVVREAKGNVTWFLRNLQISPQCEHGVLGDLIDPKASRCSQIQSLTSLIEKVDTMIRRHHTLANGSNEKLVTVMQLRVFQQLLLEGLHRLSVDVELDEGTHTLRPTTLVAIKWAATK